MYLDGISKVGVLDINHGGLVLAEKLIEMGYDAFAVDVYGTKSEPDGKIPVLKPDEVPGFDALVAPVHMPEIGIIKKAHQENRPVFTHHRMAGHIINESGRLDGIRSVEVTGTYGKTTTCVLLAKMLMESGENVLLHTSRGLFFNDMLIKGRLSITPANMIIALDTAREAGCEPTVCIFEVSLGGCGTADLGIITTLDRQYPIAGGTKSSTEAKMQMAEYAKPGSVLIHDTSLNISSPVRRITFGPGGDVCLDDAGNVCYDIMNSATAAKGIFTPILSDCFDRESYMLPIICSATAALAMGARLIDVTSAINGFRGVPGRMRKDNIGERIILDNSNSGLSFNGIIRALEYSKDHHGRRVLIIGEEKYNVCDGLDPARALSLAISAGVDDIILVGDRLRAASSARYECAASLTEGMNRAVEMTSRGDMIISCVKTWR